MKKIFIRILIKIIDRIERIINFFKKDAFIHVDYYYESKDGELYKVKDSFQIYICQWGKCKTLFRKIDWTEAKKVLKTLEKNKGKVLLSMDVGSGTSSLMIPKWAKKKLIEELRRELQ
ncbi:Uncharacterised protein [[Flavobacterium] thermophilum]|nr:Uncharacterised protein [[Flavobacterium] thermophilum]